MSDANASRSMTRESPAPAVRLTGIDKRFGAVHANRAATLEVQQGEIHALVGENGAGKSTLMKVLSGMLAPDAGTIEVGGRDVTGWSTAAAITAGVGMVHQHFMLVPTLTVAENVVLGREPVNVGTFDRARAVREVEALAAQSGLLVPAGRLVADLSVGEAQRVEILKTLYRGARILLLDEPTAVLSPPEVTELWRVLRRVRDGGATIILITHKLDEVMEVTDRVTVMRHGETVTRLSTRETTPREIARAMVGRDVSLMAVQAAGVVVVPTAPAEAAAVAAETTAATAAIAAMPALAVRDLTVRGARIEKAVNGVSFSVAPGEILGIAGVEGNGQSELADVLGGLRRPSHGALVLDGAPLRAGQVAALRRAGVGRIGEDRLHDGIAPNLSIAENLAALDYRDQPASRRGVLDRDWLKQRAREAIDRHGVVAAGPQQPIGHLSGGNMQKLVFARELAARPRCLVANQPTRGVDVGAAQRLHQSLLALRDAGTAVLLFSADIDELLVLSDRLVVMFEGRLVAHLAADAVSPRTLGQYMTGALGAGPVEARVDSPFTPAPLQAGPNAGAR